MIKQVLALFITVMLYITVYSVNEFPGTNEDVWKIVYQVPIIDGKDFGKVSYNKAAWSAARSEERRVGKEFIYRW